MPTMTTGSVPVAVAAVAARRSPVPYASPYI